MTLHICAIADSYVLEQQDLTSHHWLRKSYLESWQICAWLPPFPMSVNASPHVAHLGLCGGQSARVVWECNLVDLAYPHR